MTRQHETTAPVQPGDTIEVLLLTQPACDYCDLAKTVLGRLAQEYPLTISEIALATTHGQAIALEHGVHFAPGILINATLASYGRPSERRLRRILEQHHAGT